MNNYYQEKVISDKNSNRIIIRKKDANNRLVFPMTHVAAVIDDEGKSLEETINNLYNDIEHLQPDGFEELKSKVTALESLVSEGNNPTAAIDKFNEIVAFLDKFENTQTLDNILVTIKQDLTNSLSNKQDIITDLEVIRNGAAAGAMAQQPATTIAGYGITDAYTKQEVNNLVSTPHQNYVTVADYASLPVTGSADTIYRISSYDGVQADTTKYAEYAWNGNSYVLLAVKSSVDEVFNVSEYNGDAKYETLAAVLGNDGANIPADIRRGGMSIKFVQSSDNKYVQYRLMATEWSDVVANWQGIDDEPTPRSDNLVKSGGVAKKIYSDVETEIPFVDYVSGSINSKGNIINKDSSTLRVSVFPCKKGDIFKVRCTLYGASSAMVYAVYTTAAKEDMSDANCVMVGPVGEAGGEYTVLITDENAKLFAVQYHYKSEAVPNTWGISVFSVQKVLKTDILDEKIDRVVENIGEDSVATMIARKDWRVSGNVTYDSNEIPVSYNITWADGESGTVVMSNFNSDVFEYTTITVTYKTKTIVYTLTYDSNGYVTNETYVEQ